MGLIAGGQAVTCRLDHEHARRDGRPCDADQCHAGHRAEINDLSRLQADVDACLIFLVHHQAGWVPMGSGINLALIPLPRDAA